MGVKSGKQVKPRNKRGLLPKTSGVFKKEGKGWGGVKRLWEDHTDAEG